MPRVKSDEEYNMMKKRAEFADEEAFEDDDEEEEELGDANYNPFSNAFKTAEGGDEFFKGIKRRNREDSEPINVEKPEKQEKSPLDIELELKIVEEKQPEMIDDEVDDEIEEVEEPTKSKSTTPPPPKSEKQVLYTDDINNLAEFFKIYSDSTRLKIIHLLSLKEIAVSDISEALDITQSATSHQLKILRTHRLVKSRKVAKQVFYSLNDNHIVEILNAGITHMNEK